MLLRPRQILAPVIFATVFGYFGYHLVNGDRGLLAMAQGCHHSRSPEPGASSPHPPWVSYATRGGPAACAGTRPCRRVPLAQGDSGTRVPRAPPWRRAAEVSRRRA